MKHDVEDLGGTAVRERAGTKPGSARTDVDKQEAQRKMEEVGRPGAAHKALDALVGNWKAEVKCWMEQGGPPQVSQGKATIKGIFGGRFVEEEFHGEMMGQPFTGRTLIGFDNFKQTFNMVWISDMQTSTFVSEGKGDSGNKVITFKGQTNCPATGRTNFTIRSVLRLNGKDQHIFEMYDESQGANAKTMEITYTRQ